MHIKLNAPMVRLGSLLALVVLTTVGVDVAGAALVYNVTDLGLGNVDSGRDLNQPGTAAYTRNNSVYLWQNGGEVPVAGLTAGMLSINNANHLAGGYSQGAFLYRDGVLTNLGVLESGGLNSSTALDLNDSDVVVGDSYVGSQLRQRAFIWQNGVMSQLPAPTPDGSYPQYYGSIALGINNAGVIVGAYDPDTTAETAVRWNNGVATALAMLAGFTNSRALELNASGQAVGYSSIGGPSSRQATIWNGNTPTSLGSLPNRSYSYGNGINDQGIVVGTTHASSGSAQRDAFIWSSGQMVNLNSLIAAGSGWYLREAYQINNTGQIIGLGEINGGEHLYLLTPVPEPAALLTLGMSALMLSLRRRVRRPATFGDRKGDASL